MKLKRVLALVLTLMLFSIPCIGNVASAASNMYISNGYLYYYYGTSSYVAIPSTVKTIGVEAFAELDYVKSVAIPSSVTRIEEKAFYLTGLTSIAIPSSVTYLGDFCFGGCFNATKLSLPSSIKTIPAGCFAYCTELDSVTIPSGVTSIYSYAFADCFDLSYVYIPSSVTYISSLAFDESDNVVICAPAGSYAIDYAKSYSIPYKVTDASVISVSSDKEWYEPYDTVNIVVKADYDLNTMWRWTSGGTYVDHYTETKGDYEYWYYTFTVEEPGTYTWRFSGDSYYASANNASIIVDVISDDSHYITAEWENDTALVGETAKATIRTDKYYEDDAYLYMYLRSGEELKQIKKWNVAKHSKLVDGERVWNISHTFTGAGEKQLLFAIGYEEDDRVYAECNTTVTVAKPAYAVLSAAFKNDANAKGTAAAITVVTEPNAKYLKMYNGSSLIKTWKADGNSSLNEEGNRVWNVKYSFTGTGAKTMTFKASYDNKAMSAGVTAKTLITSGNSINVNSAAFGSDVYAKGTAAKITVKTGADAKYLKMYNGSSLIKTWKAADYSKIVGNVRVWDVSYSFTGTGTKNMTFKASKDNKTFGVTKDASVLITSGNSINVTSAAFASDMVVKGESVTITVKTGADAKYLAMFTESGSKAKTWKAASASKIEGTNRVWTLTYTFSGAGNRTMTFKASKDNSTFGTGKSDTLIITSGNDIDVTSAAFAVDSIVKGNSVTIKVTTGADAQYLAMFTESGSKAKTWKAADCSTISGASREWTVTYTFSGAGNRTLTFKASKDNSTFGEGKSDTLLITSGNDYGMKSAAFNSDVAAVGESVSITVSTGVDAKYLKMSKTDGAKVKTWKAADYSTVVDGVRVWNVSYAFSGAGLREMVFSSSADNSTYSSGVSAVILVE